MRRVILVLFGCLTLSACTVGIVEQRPAPTRPITPTLTQVPMVSPTEIETASPMSIRQTETATAVPSHTAAPSDAPPAGTPTSVPTLPPPSRTPTETPPQPQVLSMVVSPTEADPGDVVTLTWQARGERATICPVTSRYALFTEDDCRQVPVSGTMTFTIPLEATRFHSPIRFHLSVEAGASVPARYEVSVNLICHTDWFFSDERHAQGCPLEAIRSPAAVQYFERGTMVWLEELGRYFILSDALLYAPIRKQIDYVQDPLEIIRDTSAEVQAPEGFYTPESGFGLVWRGDVAGSPGYRESLGWALAPEFGYEAVYQCTEGYPSGGIWWKICFLRLPDDEVVFFHPLGGWYLLSEAD